MLARIIRRQGKGVFLSLAVGRQKVSKVKHTKVEFEEIEAEMLLFHVHLV